MSNYPTRVGFDEALFPKESDSMQMRKAWVLYLDALEQNADARGRSSPEPYTLNSVFPDEMGLFGLVLYNQLEIEHIPETDADEDISKVEFTPKQAPRALRHRTNISYAPSTPSTPEQRSFFDAIKFNSPAHEWEPKVPSAKDEQIVNLALINFLNAIWINERRKSEWSLLRKEFKFESRGSGAGFKARTDGHLGISHRLAGRSGAILEVKARQRPQKTLGDHSIAMQESAQMALWIYEEPHSHWTISPSNASKSTSGNEAAKTDKYQ
jgi:hypothetical protein